MTNTKDMTARHLAFLALQDAVIKIGDILIRDGETALINTATSNPAEPEIPVSDAMRAAAQSEYQRLVAANYPEIRGLEVPYDLALIYQKMESVRRKEAKETEPQPASGDEVNKRIATIGWHHRGSEMDPWREGFDPWRPHRRAGDPK